LPRAAGAGHTAAVSKSFTNISIVAAATAVSRVLGLGRDMLVTAVFGVGALASAFYTAFTLPNLFRRLLGEGALTAAFVPTLNEELHARQRAGAFALVNQVASWLFVVTGSIVAAAMALLWLVPRLAGGAAEWGIGADTMRRWIEAAGLAVILFPYLICVALAAVFSAALQSLNRFLEPALSPIWMNVAMIVSLVGAAYGGWSATREEAILWLCGGTLVGGVLQMAVPAGALVGEGWRPRIDLTVGGPVRQIARLMGPMVFGSAVYLINIAVSRVVGLSINESAVAVLNLATRLMELPIGVFTVAVSTVVFPLIARHAAAGDWESLAAAYRKGMRLILVINVPAAVGLVVLATPIIRVLFERGAFGPGDTAAMRPVLVVFALGLPFLSLVNIMLRAFYAEKDTTTPVRAAVLSFAINLGLSLALMVPLGTMGLAVASNVAVVAQAAYLQVRLSRRRPALGFRPVLRDLLKAMGAAGVMGVAVAAGWAAWSRSLPRSVPADVAGLALLITGGVAVYGGVVWWMRIEGRDDLAAMLARWRERFG
jgi:putative peptidoglycan lipid II flippase